MNELQKILARMTAIQKEYAGKAMPPQVGEEFETLGAEAKKLQDAAEAEKKRAEVLRGIQQFAAEVPDPSVPGTPGQSQAKTADSEKVVGYVTLGAAFVNSPEFKRYAERGFPKVGGGAGITVDVKREGNTVLMPVTAGMIEQKAVDASFLIVADRVNRVIETARPRRLFLRDLVEVLPTGSNAVTYSTVGAETDEANFVLPGGLKPYTNLAGGTATVPVRDIAVLASVTEQQLADAPQLQGLLDGRMDRQLDRKEEREMLWGDGTTFLGIYNTPGVGEMVRVRAGATIIDKIRMAITDLQLAEVEPNGVVIDPLDLEDLQLTKGTDGYYVYAVVTDAATGQSRVWGLPTVATIANRKPATTGRRLLVGAFDDGATLFDRQQSTAAIGFVNDDFARNQRTLRREKRAAFACWRPFAFRYLITAAEA